MPGGGISKIDSNATGLRYSIEASLCTLAAAPAWIPLEPNSYSDFGGTITTTPRNPINAGRQRKKGRTTDLDAAAGWNQDWTQENLTELLQSFFFADLREKADTQSYNSTAIPITNVDGTGNDYEAASGLTVFLDGHLIMASGFTTAVNNGLKVVTSGGSATSVPVTDTGLVDETPAATARLQVVGYQFDAGDATIDATGTLPALVSAGGIDFTTLSLITGEFIYIGGDASTSQFFNAENNGFKRIRSISATRIEFDKSRSDMVTDDGTIDGAGGAAQVIHVYFGHVLRNEADPTNIVRRTVQFERTLGSNTGDTALQAEYVVGSVASELTLNVPNSDKMTMDLSFIGLDSQNLDENDLPGFFPGAESAVVADAIKSQSSNLSSTAPSLTEADAFNTSSDIKGIKLYQYVDGNENPDALFAFAQDINLTANNNATANKAVGVLGGFEISVGTFEVSGTITAYFADVAAVSAVRNNADVTLDWPIVRSNAGIVVDVPLITLGNGQLNVAQDEPITVPLQTDAATAASIDAGLDYTLQFGFFPYLPTIADT